MLLAASSHSPERMLLLEPPGGGTVAEAGDCAPEPEKAPKDAPKDALDAPPEKGTPPERMMPFHAATSA